MKKRLQQISVMAGLAAVTGCSTVSFDTDNGGSIIGDDRQTIWFGGDAEEVYARPKDGYYFVKWEDPKARADHEVNPLTLKQVNDSRTVTARFASATTERTSSRQAASQVVNQAQKQVEVSNTKPAESLRYMTKTTPARITVQVIGDDKFTAITRAVEGEIANSGFEVLADNLRTGQKENPFLSVLLKNSLGEFDKLGSYYVYKGKTELTVKRNVKTLNALKTVLARKTISVKGDRKLGKDDATESLVEKLGSQSADYMKQICKREMEAVKAVNVTLRKEAIRRVFGKNMGAEQRIIGAIIKRASAIDNILSIHQVAVDMNSITLEVIYRKKNFPNGVVHDFIDGNVQVGSSDPIGEFMKYLFKI